MKKYDNNPESGRIAVKAAVSSVVIILLLFFGYKTLRFVTDNSNISALSSIEAGKGIQIDIKMGSNTSDIAEVLKKEKIIRSRFWFKTVSRLKGYDGKYRAGSFILDKSINYNNLKGYELLMKKLTGKPDGSSDITVTLKEGLTCRETADILARKGLIDAKRFDEAAEKAISGYKFLAGIPERENKLEGYLFPDTYSFQPGCGEKAVVDRLLARFGEVFKPEYYKRAAELNMTVDDIVILASIIEREAAVPEERSIISGVLYNRLNSKDKTMRRLQVDATIQYVFLNTGGEVKDRLLLDDLEIDSPYNTYKYEGLPPGPICSPGAESIKAALYPQDNDYLFYVAREDGTKTHYFSKTYSEHLNNKAKARRNRK